MHRNRVLSSFSFVLNTSSRSLFNSSKTSFYALFYASSKASSYSSSNTSFYALSHRRNVYNNYKRMRESRRHLSLLDDAAGYWTLKRSKEFNDVSIVKTKGRLQGFNQYNQCHEVIPATVATIFSSIECTNLLKETVLLPPIASSLTPSPVKAKLLLFAFKDYGLTLTPSYSNPFIAEFGENDPRIQCIEICFVEHKFLSFAKGLFISGMQKKTAPNRHSNTGFCFGGVKEMAERMNLPNIFTGYAMLLDANNKIRWQRCGEAEPDDVSSLIACTKTLLGSSKLLPK